MAERPPSSSCKKLFCSMYCPKRASISPLSVVDVDGPPANPTSPSSSSSSSTALKAERALAAWCFASASAIASKSSSFDWNISSSESSWSEFRIGAWPPSVLRSFAFAAASGPSTNARQMASSSASAACTAAELSSFPTSALPITVTWPIHAARAHAAGPGLKPSSAAAPVSTHLDGSARLLKRRASCASRTSASARSSGASAPSAHCASDVTCV
mmetsp:Transcript_977/g.3092  ORF Transcript_977/g.3092 Transcript_977/m.3092 type:complete len:215 (-) Transcript_977:142-786(-)